jgi:phosphatidylinositol kinase/protein kinase (PI-3  family)
MMQNSPG